MTINSTEESRYQELKNTIIPITNDIQKSNITFGQNYTSSGKAQYWKDLYQYATNVLNLQDKYLYFPNFSYPVILNRNSISESISNSPKDKESYFILAKVFSNIKNICNNATLINIDKYKYPWRPIAPSIEAEYYLLSILKINHLLYPIQIIIEDKKQKQESNIHLLLSTEGIKEPISLLSSSSIELSKIIMFFDKSHQRILKHFPDKLLSPYQQNLKQNAITYDLLRVEKIHERDINNARKKRNTSMINSQKFIPFYEISTVSGSTYYLDMQNQKIYGGKLSEPKQFYGLEPIKEGLPLQLHFEGKTLRTSLITSIRRIQTPTINLDSQEKPSQEAKLQNILREIHDTLNYTVGTQNTFDNDGFPIKIISINGKDITVHQTEQSMQAAIDQLTREKESLEVGLSGLIKCMQQITAGGVLCNIEFTENPQTDVSTCIIQTPSMQYKLRLDEDLTIDRIGAITRNLVEEYPHNMALQEASNEILRKAAEIVD